MNTAERRIAARPAAKTYDGFISYSHAADDLLAPRLQAGLQRFAKPWWKRRAVRIFRDESSLAADPHLWSSITEALDESDWFVLLLSPDAANSEWVGKEIEHWVANKPADRILPVLTDGDFEWVNGDVAGSSVPQALYGVFTGEPRWVDLRFAKGDEDLDIQNPDFSAAVADIASAIRGVPKDELASEEVRQHRRTVRTAWAAATALVLLTVVAVVASIFALDQRDDARRQAELARANELLAHSTGVLESDAELGTLLAVSSIDIFQAAGEIPARAVTALRAANAGNRVVARFPGGRFVDTHASLVATASEDGVAVWDLTTGEVVETLLSEGSAPIGVAFSPDGRLIAVSYAGRTPPVTITARSTGATFDLGKLELFPDLFSNPLSFDPSGTYLTIDSFIAGFEVWSVPDRTLLGAFSDGAYAGFTPDGLLSYTSLDGAVIAVDLPSLELVHTYPVELSGFGHWASWSPTSNSIAVATSRTQVLVLGATDGAVASTSTHERVWRPLWLPGSESLLIGGESGLRVVDARDGTVIRAFGEEAGGASFEYRLMDSGLVASAGFGEETVVFDPSSIGGVELAGWAAPIPEPEYVVYGSSGDRIFVSGGQGYAIADAATGLNEVTSLGADPSGSSPFANASGTLFASGEASGSWSIRDLQTGAVELAPPSASAVLAIDPAGERAVFGVGSDCGDRPSTRDLPSTRLVTLTGASAAELGCWQWAEFSGDGSRLLLLDGAGRAAIVDGATGSLLAELDLAGYEPGLESWVVARFTPTEDRLLLGDAAGFVYVLATEDLLAGTDLPGATVSVLPAHDNLILTVVVSPDGSMVATRAVDEPLRLWHLSTGDLLWEMDDVSSLAFHPTDPQMAVLNDAGAVRIHTLDTGELAKLARYRLQRSYTVDECRRYNVDPCPTLDKIRSR